MSRKEVAPSQGLHLQQCLAAMLFPLLQMTCVQALNHAMTMPMHYTLCMAAIPCLTVEETYGKTYGASSLFCLTSELPDGERMPSPTLILQTRDQKVNPPGEDCLDLKSTY